MAANVGDVVRWFRIINNINLTFIHRGVDNINKCRSPSSIDYRLIHHRDTYIFVERFSIYVL